MLPFHYDRRLARLWRRGSTGLVALAVVVGVVLGSVTPAAHGQSSSDPRAERDRVRSDRAQTAAQVNALEADDAEVRAALDALDDNLRGKNAAHADAQRAAGDAERAVAAAHDAVVQKQAEIADLRAQLSEVAVAAYVNPPSEDALDTLRAGSANESVRKRAFLDASAGRGTDLLDQLRAAEDDLNRVRLAAELAEVEAQQRRDALQTQVQEAQAARSQQAEFAAQVASRLDSKLAEAAALSETDATLSAEISAREAEVAASLARARAANPPAPNTGGGGGGGGGPVVVPGPVPLTNVRGIVVHSSIAGQLESLLAAAEAAGIVMSGTGYRDSSAQVALRRQNCGTSDYAIYQMPAEQCSPATARPGASKHEQGLAVDFTQGGRTLTYGSAAYAWMSANAGRFGWVNLPGEPWHWSVGGG